MTNVTSRHDVLLTKLLMCFYLLASIHGAPSTEPSLTASIKQQGCLFPPAQLKLPKKCGELPLNAHVDRDLHQKDSAEFYLCAGLLDSTSRLCKIVSKNREFRERVDRALNESLLTNMAVTDGSFCEEMTVLDTNTTMDEAKFCYNSMKPLYCASICVGIDRSESELREPICKWIQFAHQQIRTAIELQKKLNTPDQNTEKEILIDHKMPTATGENTNQPRPAVDEAQSSQKSNVAVTLDRSRTTQNEASNTGAAADKTPSESQPADSTLSQTKDRPEVPKSESFKPNVLKPEAKVPATDSTKSGDMKTAAEKSPASPAEANMNEQVNSQKAAKLDQENPDLPPKPEENTEDIKGGRNDQTDGEDSNPLTDDTDGLDVGDDDIPGDGAQERDRDVAEKPPVVESKMSEAEVSIPQLKITPLLISGGRGNFEEAEDSHFFAYFMSLSALFVLGYLVYHNKRKIIAMAVEGKKGRNTGRRRPNSASYHKLDSNLEEAMSSNLASTNSYVIY